MLRTTLLLSSFAVLFLTACPPPPGGEGEGEGAAGEGEGAAGEGEGAAGEGEGAAGEGEGAGGEGEGEGAAGEGEGAAGEGEGAAGEGEGAAGEGEGEGAPPAECLTPTSATVGSNNTGDTTGGATGLIGDPNLFGVGCLADASGTEQVWSFTPPHSGELTVTVTPTGTNPTADLGFYMRTACGDDTTNLVDNDPNLQNGPEDCVDDQGPGNAESGVFEVGTTPLFIIVDTFADQQTPAAPGPYTLDLGFTASSCGDSNVTGTEQCDGTNLNGATCSDVVPASSGALTCKSDCTFDTTQCAPVCVSANEKTANVGDNAGDTTQGTNALALGCDVGALQQGQNPGNEQIWTFTPTQTGFVNLKVTPSNNAQLDFALDVRTACADDNSEESCSDFAAAGQVESLDGVPVTANTAITIVVKSFTDADNGAYALNVAFNTADEVEPNNTTATAEAITLTNGTKTLTGDISPAGDVDCFSFAVDAGKTIKADVGDGGDGRCTNLQIDSVVSIFDSTDPNAAAVASNDDISRDPQAGLNLCSSVTTPAAAAAGTFFVCVSTSTPNPAPDASVYEYTLTITVQ